MKINNINIDTTVGAKSEKIYDRFSYSLLFKIDISMLISLYLMHFLKIINKIKLLLKLKKTFLIAIIVNVCITIPR